MTGTPSDSDVLSWFNASKAQWNIEVQNIGSGTLTVSRNGLNIDAAAANLSLSQGQGVAISTDGSNYFTERGMGSSSSVPNGTTLGDILVWNGSAWTLLHVGSDGQVLTANSTASLGVQWATPGTVTIVSGTPGSYTNYRLYITASGSSHASMADWRMYDSGGTQIATTTGTASSNSTLSGFPPSNAFDGLNSTFWDSAAAPSSSAPILLMYTFPSAVTVASFSITARPDSFFAETPTTFALQGSNDGTTWTTLGNYVTGTYTTSSQAKTFTI